MHLVSVEAIPMCYISVGCIGTNIFTAHIVVRVCVCVFRCLLVSSLLYSGF